MWVVIGVAVVAVIGVAWASRGRRENGAQTLGSVSHQWLSEHGAHYRDGSGR